MEGGEMAAGGVQGAPPSTKSQGACCAIGQRVHPFGAEGCFVSVSKPNPQKCRGAALGYPAACTGHRIQPRCPSSHLLPEGT